MPQRDELPQYPIPGDADPVSAESCTEKVRPLRRACFGLILSGASRASLLFCELVKEEYFNQNRLGGLGIGLYESYIVSIKGKPRVRSLVTVEPGACNIY